MRVTSCFKIKLSRNDEYFFWRRREGGVIMQSNAYLQNLCNICCIIKVIKRSKTNLIDLYIYVYFYTNDGF